MPLSVPVGSRPSRVATRPVATPFQSTAVPSGVFGQDRAAAMADFAAARTGDADALHRVSQRMQIEDNERETKLLDVAYSEKLRLLGQGDGTEENPGYFNTRGELTLQASPLAKTAVQDARREIMDGVKNSSVRDAFSLASAARAEQELQSMDVHASRERRSANNTASDARINEARDDAMAHPWDQAILGRSLALTTSEIADKAQREGWSSEKTKSEAEAAQSLILSDVIKTQMIQDPVAAAAFYEKFKPHIDGGLQPGLEEMLQNASVDERGSMAADGVMGIPGLTDAERRAKVREIDNVKVRDNAMARVNRRIVEDAQAEVQVEQDIEDEVYEFVNGREGTFEDWARLNPEKAQVARRNNSLVNNTRATSDLLAAGEDHPRRSNLEALTTTGTMTPEQLVNVNPLSYASKLSDPDYDALLQRIRGAKGALDVEGPNIAEYNALDARITKAAPRKLNIGRANETEADRSTYLRILGEGNAWLAQQISQGKVPDGNELAKKATELWLDADRSEAAIVRDPISRAEQRTVMDDGRGEISAVMLALEGGKKKKVKQDDRINLDNAMDAWNESLFAVGIVPSKSQQRLKALELATPIETGVEGDWFGYNTGPAGSSLANRNVPADKREHIHANALVDADNIPTHVTDILNSAFAANRAAVGPDGAGLIKVTPRLRGRLAYAYIIGDDDLYSKLITEAAK